MNEINKYMYYNIFFYFYTIDIHPHTDLNQDYGNDYMYESLYDIHMYIWMYTYMYV